MRTVLTFFVLLFTTYLSAQIDLRAIYNQGMEAYKTRDFETFQHRMQMADSLSPMHPTITYNLAVAYAKNQRLKLAYQTLEKAILMNAEMEPENDNDFSELDLSDILKLKRAMHQEVGLGEIAFTNSDKDLHPESVAYDPKSGHFFLNSVRKGKVLRFDPQSKKFSEFSSGHWAVMGMRVDGDYLWACEVATREWEEFQESAEGKTALLKFDLTSGKLVRRSEVDGGHWFGDVVISSKGQPYVSDSMKPVIYTLDNNQLVIFKDFTDELFNLQGLAFNSDESLLYIADYKIGIHILNVKSGKLTSLDGPDNLITKGTDGLYFYENSLIAVQNGVRPFRVTQLILAANGEEVQSFKYLDKAREELGEPTLGVIAKDHFYYVANSPWGAYKEGRFSSEGLKNNIILKVLLK